MLVSESGVLYSYCAIFYVMADVQRSDIDTPTAGFADFLGESNGFLGEFYPLKGSYCWPMPA